MLQMSPYVENILNLFNCVVSKYGALHIVKTLAPRPSFHVKHISFKGVQRAWETKQPNKKIKKKINK